MKLKSKILVVAAVLGALASLPAHAFGTWNNATYAARYRPVTPTFQVAVVKSSSSQRAAGATAQRPWGPARPCAVHSH